MKKKLILLICLFYLITLFPTHSLSAKRMIIFPYKNNGSLEYDYLSNLIPTYLFALLKNLPEYTVIPLHELKTVMNEKGLTQNDMEDQTKRNVIIEHFNVEYVVRGQYTYKNNVLIADLFIDSRETRMDYRDMGSGELRVPVIYTLETIFLPMVEKFIEREIDTALLEVTPDLPCQLYIDGIECGTTPVQIRFYSGGHEVKIIYRDEKEEQIIYDNTIMIKKGEDTRINIRVFVNLEITAENPCTLKVNGEDKGETPFCEKIFSGKEYHVQVFYTDNNGIREVYNEIISSTDSTDEVLYFSASGSISISPSQYPFHVSLEKNEGFSLPHMFKELDPGDYTITVYLDDPYWKTRWIFYDKTHTISPYEYTVLDMNALSYSYNPAYCFLPSLSQFHNRQAKKGSIILAAFLSSATATIVSVILGNRNYDEYKAMIDDIQENGLGSQYNEEDVNEKQAQNLLYNSLIAGGIITTGVIYIYSFIDGAVVMHHISRLLHRK